MDVYFLGAVQPRGTFFLVIVVDCWDIATPPCGDDDKVVSKKLSGRVGMLEKEYNLVAGLPSFFITFIS